MPATEPLIAKIDDEGMWDCIWGRPELKTRATDLHFENADFPLPIADGARLIDIQPVPQSPGEWLVLLDSGRLVRFHPQSGSVVAMPHREDFGFAVDDECGICVSPQMDFAAVYQASGNEACVIELATGAIAMRLHRDGYHSENSSFPIAFFRHDGRTLLVGGQIWNRLDIFDPVDGKVLTEREQPPYTRESGRPEHYLDYFHASLSVSPDGRWIVDNGWFWHPLGIVRAWSLADWLRHGCSPPDREKPRFLRGDFGGSIGVNPGYRTGPSRVLKKPQGAEEIKTL